MRFPLIFVFLLFWTIEGVAESDKKQGSIAGLVPTLNKYGYMSDFLLDPYSLDFLIFATETPKHILEIGAGFGKLSLEIINYGGSAVINDLDPRHIQAVEEKVQKQYRNKIDFVVGAFPLETNFRDNTFDAVFVRVTQFLSGDLIEKGLLKIYKWLKPGGRIYIVSPTIHMPHVQKHVLESFKRRRKSGDNWPGSDIESRDVFPRQIAENMPSKVHLMDLDVLVKGVLRCGFEVLRVGYYDRFKRDRIEDIHERSGLGIIGVKE